MNEAEKLREFEPYFFNCAIKKEFKNTENISYYYYTKYVLGIICYTTSFKCIKNNKYHFSKVAYLICG